MCTKTVAIKGFKREKCYSELGLICAPYLPRPLAPRFQPPHIYASVFEVASAILLQTMAHPPTTFNVTIAVPCLAAQTVVNRLGHGSDVTHRRTHRPNPPIYLHPSIHQPSFLFKIHSPRPLPLLFLPQLRMEFLIFFVVLMREHLSLVQKDIFAQSTRSETMITSSSSRCTAATQN